MASRGGMLAGPTVGIDVANDAVSSVKTPLAAPATRAGPTRELFIDDPPSFIMSQEILLHPADVPEGLLGAP